MREHHLHFASGRRDDRLARIRKLTLWIGGVAAAASLGLGTAFAHALPGHASTTATMTGRKPTAGVHASGSAGPSGAAAASPSASTSPRHNRHKGLAQPQQQPSPTQAPPVVSSGGS